MNDAKTVQCSHCTHAVIDLETAEPFCAFQCLGFDIVDPDVHDTMDQAAGRLQDLAEALARLGCCPWYVDGEPRKPPPKPPPISVKNSTYWQSSAVNYPRSQALGRA